MNEIPTYGEMFKVFKDQTLFSSFRKGYPSEDIPIRKNGILYSLKEEINCTIDL